MKVEQFLGASRWIMAELSSILAVTSVVMFEDGVSFSRHVTKSDCIHAGTTPLSDSAGGQA